MDNKLNLLVSEIFKAVILTLIWLSGIISEGYYSTWYSNMKLTIILMVLSLISQIIMWIFWNKAFARPIKVVASIKNISTDDHTNFIVQKDSREKDRTLMFTVNVTKKRSLLSFLCKKSFENDTMKIYIKIIACDNLFLECDTQKNFSYKNDGLVLDISPKINELITQSESKVSESTNVIIELKRDCQQGQNNSIYNLGLELLINDKPVTFKKRAFINTYMMQNHRIDFIP